MPPLLLTGLGSVGWAAVGMPPKVPEGEPLNMMGGIFVLVVVALGFYCSVRLATRLDVKISSLELFHDLDRELGIGGPRPRGRGHP